jgi:predicted aspartyl protease
MSTLPLLFGENNCFYVETNICNQQERLLIDTGFSSYLCLAARFKKLFPDIHTFVSFETEFTLADSSKKIFKQYSIPMLTIFDKNFSQILTTFNEDESIIGVKMLESLGAKLKINFQNKSGVLLF